MTVEARNSDLPTQAAAATVSPAKSQRAEVRRFFTTSAGFLAGYLAAALALDGAIGSYLHKTGQRGGLGPEVQIAIERVDNNSRSVQAVVLGDSVARQLFYPFAEPGPQVRFLTSNQAITMAGQCYLAENAMKRCPNLQDVYLLYLPAAWLNDMPREFTHDYFCGHFHTLGEVIEVFKVKRDFELSFAHGGRWLLPHLMAANSLSRPAFAMQPDVRQNAPTAAGPAPIPPDPERLLTEFSALFAPPASTIPPEPSGKQAVVLSPVSRYYLGKLREECRQRGIRLHILPCPVSAEKNRVEFVDPDHVYDAPILGDVPAEELIDAVHFKPPYVDAARERMIQFYGLDLLRMAGSR
jgi:hypothetical protein